MHIQTKFLEYIKAVNHIITPLDISDNQLAQIQHNIEQAELIVPVVGGFSAGKSTLINSFLGNNILPTAVTPETALATELRYSTSDYIEAVTSSGSVERYDINEFSSLKDNAKNLKNLRVYLNNEHLKAIQPLVLVDMPGFDSPIENHNQAILNYLNRGVYFVFLTSVEDGNITLSMKREIENIQQFGKGFAFCISKTNLRVPNDVQAVQQKIAEQLEDDFDHTGQIVLLDMDGGNNLKNILQAINPEELFRSLFIDELRENYNALTQSINLKISTFKSSKQSVDNTILALKKTIDKLSEQKSTALAEVENRYSANKINAISEKVVQNLFFKKEQLIDLALQNPNAFSNEFSDVVKNTLLSEVRHSFQNISSEIIQDFDSSIRLNLAQDGLLIDSDILDRIQNGTEMLLNRASAGLNNLSNNMKEHVEKTENISKVYRTVATIVGLTTSVVAPALEIVLIFLPDIIQFFTKHMREQKMREQVEQQIVHTIIPNIKIKIRETLPEIFNDQVVTLINQISEQFEAQLAQKRDEIQAAEAEKAAKATKLESMIAELENGKQQLATTANQYLFA